MAARDKKVSRGTSRRDAGEVRLYTNHREREMYDNLANLYSIIKTTEALEKAYVRDAITAVDYKKQCTKLITQFKAAQTLTKESAPDIKKFMADYRLDCKAAYQRLVVEGVPISGGQSDDTARTIAETVQFFITAMDSLKLGMLAVDQVQPLLGDLLEALSKVSNLPPDWEGKVKVRDWLSTMHTMAAHEELDESQGRQMLFDLEQAYTQFHKSLS
jgi:ESCRT-I complex subunit VPS28